MKQRWALLHFEYYLFPAPPEIAKIKQNFNMPSIETLDHIVVKPKRFQCGRCQRSFARLEHLQRHERTRE